MLDGFTFIGGLSHEMSSPVTMSIVASVLFVVSFELHIHFRLSFRETSWVMRTSMARMRSSVRAPWVSAMSRLMVGSSLVVLLTMLLGELSMSVETEHLLVFFFGPVTHVVHGDFVTVSVLLTVFLDESHFLGKNGESELILLFSSIGFTVLGKILEIGLLNFSVDLEEIGVLGAGVGGVSSNGGSNSDTSGSSVFHSNIKL